MKFSFINQDALLLVTGYLCLITNGTTLGAWWKTALMSLFFNRHSEECYNQFFFFSFFMTFVREAFLGFFFGGWIVSFYAWFQPGIVLFSRANSSHSGPRFWLPGFQFQFCHLLPAWVQCSNSAAQPLQASVFSLKSWQNNKRTIWGQMRCD